MTKPPDRPSFGDSLGGGRGSSYGGAGQNRNKKKSEVICRCNSVRRDVIEDAIANKGCHTLNAIFDETQAGVGACGGSCRRKLGPLLDHYLATGTFPEKIIEDMTGKFPADPGAMPEPSSEDVDEATEANQTKGTERSELDSDGASDKTDGSAKR